MTKKAKLPDAGRFNLASFADILPARDPIIGEDPGSFEVFHEGLMLSLAPVTPYECVIAENLISIESELQPHRRMLEGALRQSASTAVRTAVFRRIERAYRQELDAAWERHLALGGS